MTITEIGNELVNIAETLARVISELTSLAGSVTKLSTALKADEVGRNAPNATQKKTAGLPKSALCWRRYPAAEKRRR